MGIFERKTACLYAGMGVTLGHNESLKRRIKWLKKYMYT